MPGVDDSRDTVGSRTTPKEIRQILGIADVACRRHYQELLVSRFELTISMSVDSK